ncbi:MAG: biotin--[acetyl-CoA-carboxylase] ligase [Calditrichaeota bacterium]|nr:biotin--[acetyl-CoA-carboxylase] ligase [Calditrichota bacterium]
MGRGTEKNKMTDLSKAKHLHFQSLDSTNSYAKFIADQEAKPFIVTADYQLQGRGRLGNNWHSIAGGIYYSLVIHLGHFPFKSVHYPFLISLAVYHFLENYISSGLFLKWPNDVLINKKKIAGILQEQAGRNLVIGIGININQDPSQIDAKKETVSLAKLCNRSFDTHELIAELTHQIDNEINQYNKNPDQLFSDVKQLYQSLNSIITCRIGSVEKRGRFIDLGKNGELLLETANGVEAIYAAEIIE